MRISSLFWYFRSSFYEPLLGVYFRLFWDFINKEYIYIYIYNIIIIIIIIFNKD
jgi:hypothetical protein